MTVASPSSRTRSTTSQICDVRHRRSCAGFISSALSSSRSIPQVLAQPRDAAELQRVRHLVQRDPAQQLVGRRVERFAACARLGATNSSRAGCSGSSTGTRTGRARARPGSRDAPASTAITPPASDRPAGRACRPPARRGLEHGLERLRGSRRSSPALDRLGDRHGLGGDEAGVGGDEALGLRGRPASCSKGSGLPAGCILATPRATVPASFQSITFRGWHGARRGHEPEPRRVPRACVRRSPASAARCPAARPADRRRR